MNMRLALVFSCVFEFEAVVFAQAVEAPSQVSIVRSKDRARIALECAGQGPAPLTVHEARVIGGAPKPYCRCSLSGSRCVRWTVGVMAKASEGRTIACKKSLRMWRPQ